MKQHAKLITLLACGVAPLLGACSDGESTISAAPLELTDGMEFYVGNLHAHTRYSDGSGSPSDGFSWARDSVGLDFYAITDHAELLSNSEWNDLGTQAEAFNEDGAFVALRGFEYTNYFSGHINVFDTSSRKSFWNYMVLGWFYDWLGSSGGISQFNHPGDPSDFSNYSYAGRCAENMALMEVGNGGTAIASNEYLPEFERALAKGWKVAPTSNLDNHSLSDSGRRTVVVAEALTRADLLEALRQRRVYATDDANLELAFLFDGAWMGSTVAVSAGTHRFDVSVADDDAIGEVELIANGTVVASIQPMQNEISWRPAVALNSDSWIYVKVTGADGDVTVSAPIWLEI